MRFTNGEYFKIKIFENNNFYKWEYLKNKIFQNGIIEWGIFRNENFQNENFVFFKFRIKIFFKIRLLHISFINV